jgi:hypothetical protein
MKITLVGAAGGEVTRSCYMVETKQARILVDCGLFQGGKPFARLRDAGSYSDRQNRSLSAMRTIPRFKFAATERLFLTAFGELQRSSKRKD